MAFSSMAAGGVAKTLVAVTVSLHPAAAHHGGRYVTVRSGDTLSAISKSEYGSSADWPALWWVNRHAVRDPASIRVGQRLRLSAWHPVRSWLTRDALAAVSGPAPAAQAVSQQKASAPVPAETSGSYSAASGSFQSCVIQAESGGDAGAVNPATGAGGLYGFMPSTWQALGYSGLPEDASVAEQNAAFAKEYAESGGSAWSAYDGC